MALIEDRIWVTGDESFMEAERIGRNVENMLRRLKLDTYNKVYAIRVTVDEVDSNEPDPRDPLGEEGD